MSKIFISYRRDDSAYVAGQLHEKLQEAFDKDSVFLDVDTIPIGVDFREHINNAMNNCDVFLVVIGDTWIGEKTVMIIIAQVTHKISLLVKLQHPLVLL